jgi:glycosyltransferase involved in cell wall biosynthesis
VAADGIEPGAPGSYDASLVAPQFAASAGAANEVISVVLPVYNSLRPRVGDRWLRETVKSVIAQRGVALELVIVDDGSVDDTPLVLREYDEWPHINVLSLRKSRGYAAALNAGIYVSAGSRIGLISVGDVFLSPSKLLEQAVALREQSCHVIACDVVKIDGAGERVEEVPAPSTHESTVAALRENWSVWSAGVVFHKTVWSLAGGYSTDPRFRYWEDHEFLVRVARHSAGFRFGSVSTPLYGFRLDADRSSLSRLIEPLRAANRENVQTLAERHLRAGSGG